MPIQILCGGSGIPDEMERAADLDDIRRSWQKDVSAFLKQREPYLLY